MALHPSDTSDERPPCPRPPAAPPPAHRPNAARPASAGGSRRPQRWARSRAQAAVLLGVCLSLALGPAAARAQGAPAESSARTPSKEDMAQAKQHFQTGLKAFQANQYPVAAKEFEEAYRLSRRPDLLFNLARVAETMGQSAQAVEYLESYLRERPDAPDRAQVRKDIDRLRHQLAQAEREVQAAPVPVVPLQPVAVAPATAPAAVVAQPAPSRSRLPPWPALGLMAGGAAVLITGFVLGGVALSTANQVQAGPTYDPDLDSRGRSLNGAAIALDVVGGVALAAGVGWTVWWATHRKPPPLQATVGATPGLGFLGVGGTF